MYIENHGIFSDELELENVQNDWILDLFLGKSLIESLSDKDFVFKIPEVFHPEDITAKIPQLPIEKNINETLERYDASTLNKILQIISAIISILPNFPVDKTTTILKFLKNNELFSLNESTSLSSSLIQQNYIFGSVQLQHLLSLEQKVKKLLNLDEFSSVLGEYRDELPNELKDELSISNIDVQKTLENLREYLTKQLSTPTQENLSSKPLGAW